TLAENLESVPGLTPNQQVIRPLTNPIKPTGHICILRGNLAPLGSVAKITGKEGLYFEGPANVYDNESDMLHGLERGEVRKGQVIIIRYSGPKGGPGMPEMLTPTSAIMGAGLGNDKTIDVKVSEQELAERRAAWVAPPYKATRGTLYKYIKTVKNASEGCVTDE
ncbi:hypothetical protein BGZ74_001931, partial [Mortierella antarctica]